MPDWTEYLRPRLAVLRLSPNRESDIIEELSQHLDLRYEELRAGGATDVEACRVAIEELREPDVLAERMRPLRQAHVPPPLTPGAPEGFLLGSLWQDLRYAVRVLRKQPGFTATAVLTLALGIGANTAIFSVVHAVLLQPLPYENSDQLVRVMENVSAERSITGRPERVSSMYVDEFLEWRTRTTRLSHMGLYLNVVMTLTGQETSVRLRGARVSSSIFPMLGLRATLGRTFVTGEEVRGADAVVLLSHGVWQRFFARDPAIVGRVLTLDGRGYQVVGVMGQDSEFPDAGTEFWIPLVPLDPSVGQVMRAPLIARLKDGASLADAAREANTIATALRGTGAAAPQVGTTPFEVVRVQDQLVAPVRPALLILVVAVGAVLLIACANVANLLLARSLARRREMAIRGALGARKFRLVQQVVTETLGLALIGGTAGLVLAYGGVRVVKTLASVDAPRWLSNANNSLLPRGEAIAIDGSVLGFTFATACVTGLLCALAPVLSIARDNHLEVIKHASASASSGASLLSRHRARSLLVIAQLGLATMLLISAGLLIRSFAELSNVHPGYDPTNVLTFQAVLPRGGTTDFSQSVTFAEQLTGRLERLPRVQAVGFTSILPLSTARWTLSFTIPGVSLNTMPLGERPETRYVSRDYLRAMGVRLVDGRWFTEQDRPGSAKAVLINRALARRFLPQRNPIGAVVSLAGEPWEIVGVVEDVRQGPLDTEPNPQWFVDFRQLPAKAPVVLVSGGVFFTVRTSGDPLPLVSTIRGVIQQIDPRVALDSVYTMDQLVSSSLARPRFYATLLGIFAAVASGLAVVGIYGVLAYAVAQRTREIGIRVALGAQRDDVLGLVLRQAAVLVVIGMGAGLAGAVGMTRYLSGLLFGITPLDAPTYAAVTVTFAAVAMLASYVPARRATKVDPLVALRHE
jgi:putative ABC transport system permease protein